MPKMREMLLYLEGFKCATPQDQNMGYYHIRLRKQASNLSTIISRGESTCTNAY